MKALWFSVIPACLWVISALHHYFHLSVQSWYGAPLVFTYLSIVGGAVILAVNKGLD